MRFRILLHTSVLAAVWAGALLTGVVAQTPRVPVPAHEPEKPDFPRLPGEPPHPDPGTYGLDPQTGIYRHPAATPSVEGPHPFPGSLDYLDQSQYQT